MEFRDGTPEKYTKVFNLNEDDIPVDVVAGMLVTFTNSSFLVSQVEIDTLGELPDFMDEIDLSAGWVNVYGVLTKKTP